MHRDHIVFFCWEDQEPLELVSGEFSLFYACPYRKKYNKNRKTCNTRISLKDAEMIYEWIGEHPKDHMKMETDRWTAVCRVYEDYIKVFIKRKKKRTQRMSG